MIKKWAVIGGGVMAEAFLSGVLAKGIIAPAAVAVGEPLEERCHYLRAKYQVNAFQDNHAALADADAVLLAVKPQVAGAVLADIASSVDEAALVLSIVAGLPISKIRQALSARAVIRVMPNTPAQVGEGMSVWNATPQVSQEQKAWARSVLASLGEELEVVEEKYLDMATAISGSGPAYVFLFVEAMADAGVMLGFSREVALRLVWQTVRGSAVYGSTSGEHPAVLRNRVTSPGGTTAEALDVLEQAGFRAAISQAIRACYLKSVQLGQEVH